jgi:hypothetical protein
MVPAAGADCAGSGYWRTWLSAARVERRLADIFAADVAGYLQFMGWNEAGVRLVDAARKWVPITASGWQRF